MSDLFIYLFNEMGNLMIRWCIKNHKQQADDRNFFPLHSLKAGTEQEGSSLMALVASTEEGIKVKTSYEM